MQPPKSQGTIKPAKQGERNGHDRSGQPTQYQPYVPKRAYKFKYFEYMNADWRFKRSEINITHNTVIPGLPEKPLQESGDAAYQSRQVECDERVELLNQEIEDVDLEK